MSLYGRFCAFLSTYALLWFNLLSLVSSVFIFTVTIIVTVNVNHFNIFVEKCFMLVPQILLIIGIVIFTISIIGFFGVIRDSRFLLILFSVLLTTALSGELLLSASVHQLRDKIKDYALKEMTKSLSLYNSTDQIYKRTWDAVQYRMECCGIDGPNDWASVMQNNTLPTTCCEKITADEKCTEKDSFKLGCLKYVETRLKDNEKIIFWSSIGFALIQFSAILLAWSRSRFILQEYKRM